MSKISYIATRGLQIQGSKYVDAKPPCTNSCTCHPWLTFNVGWKTIANKIGRFINASLPSTFNSRLTNKDIPYSETIRNSRWGNRKFISTSKQEGTGQLSERAIHIHRLEADVFSLTCNEVRIWTSSIEKGQFYCIQRKNYRPFLTKLL